MTEFHGAFTRDVPRLLTLSCEKSSLNLVINRYFTVSFGFPDFISDSRFLTYCCTTYQALFPDSDPSKYINL